MHTSRFSFSTLRGNSQYCHLTEWCMRSLLGVALIFFWLPTSAAQTTKSGDIVGAVVDRKLEKPLVSHLVTLTIHNAEGTETEQVLTDENGNYRFEGLPLDPTVHYTVSTIYEDTDYTEADVVLSTWAPNITLDFNIGAFTDDRSQIRIKTHSFIIGPPPEDHTPDGAVTIIEAVGIENRSELPFQMKRGAEKIGLHLTVPKGVEAFQAHSPAALTMDFATNEVILKTPLPPGEAQFGYTYIFHVERDNLNLSRHLDFDTVQFMFFIPEGIGLVPNAKFFGAPSREQIHNNIYLIYQSPAGKVFEAGTTIDLALNVHMGATGGPVSGQNSNLGQLIFIAVAAALTGGFFVAALFKLRAANNSTTSDTDDTSTSPEPADAGWLRKLNPDDLEHTRVARLEFITHLDDKYERQEISERVYKRLRREQTERLTTLLEQQKRGNNA